MLPRVAINLLLCKFSKFFLIMPEHQNSCLSSSFVFHVFKSVYPITSRIVPDIFFLDYFLVLQFYFHQKAGDILQDLPHHRANISEVSLPTQPLDQIYQSYLSLIFSLQSIDSDG
jgi:hypothetical protein